MRNFFRRILGKRADNDNNDIDRSSSAKASVVVPPLLRIHTHGTVNGSPAPRSSHAEAGGELDDDGYGSPGLLDEAAVSSFSAPAFFFSPCCRRSSGSNTAARFGSPNSMKTEAEGAAATMHSPIPPRSSSSSSASRGQTSNVSGDNRYAPGNAESKDAKAEDANDAGDAVGGSKKNEETAEVDDAVDDFLANVIAGKTDVLRKELAKQKLEAAAAAAAAALAAPHAHAHITTLSASSAMPSFAGTGGVVGAGSAPQQHRTDPSVSTPTAAQAAAAGVGSSTRTSAQLQQHRHRYVSSAARSLQDYELIAFLGSGTFAEVTLARRKVTDDYFAVKKISKQRVKEEGCVERTFTERQLLASLQHPFLVRLYQAFQSQTHLYLVLDFAQGGDLFYLNQQQLWLRSMKRVLIKMQYPYYQSTSSMFAVTPTVQAGVPPSPRSAAQSPSSSPPSQQQQPASSGQRQSQQLSLSSPSSLQQQQQQQQQQQEEEHHHHHHHHDHGSEHAHHHHSHRHNRSFVSPKTQPLPTSVNTSIATTTTTTTTTTGVAGSQASSTDAVEEKTLETAKRTGDGAPSGPPASPFTRPPLPPSAAPPSLLEQAPNLAESSSDNNSNKGISTAVADSTAATASITPKSSFTATRTMTGATVTPAAAATREKQTSAHVGNVNGEAGDSELSLTHVSSSVLGSNSNSNNSGSIHKSCATGLWRRVQDDRYYTTDAVDEFSSAAAATNAQHPALSLPTSTDSVSGLAPSATATTTRTETNNQNECSNASQRVGGGAGESQTANQLAPAKNNNSNNNGGEDASSASPDTAYARSKPHYRRRRLTARPGSFSTVADTSFSDDDDDDTKNGDTAVDEGGSKADRHSSSHSSSSGNDGPDDRNPLVCRQRSRRSPILPSRLPPSLTNSAAAAARRRRGTQQPSSIGSYSPSARLSTTTAAAAVAVAEAGGGGVGNAMEVSENSFPSLLVTPADATTAAGTPNASLSPLAVAGGDPFTTREESGAAVRDGETASAPPPLPSEQQPQQPQQRRSQSRSASLDLAALTKTADGSSFDGPEQPSAAAAAAASSMKKSRRAEDKKEQKKKKRSKTSTPDAAGDAAASADDRSSNHVKTKKKHVTPLQPHSSPSFAMSTPDAVAAARATGTSSNNNNNNASSGSLISAAGGGGVGGGNRRSSVSFTIPALNPAGVPPAQEAAALAAAAHVDLAAPFQQIGMESSTTVLRELPASKFAADDTHRFPLRLIAFYAVEIALVLQYLHGEGFLYRDLKPENVLMRGDGHVMLTDFGVAKYRKGAAIATAAGLTSSNNDSSTASASAGGSGKAGDEAAAVGGNTAATADGRANSFTGTTQYMSPEMLRGLPHDSRTDWWSYGCLLFEWANGRKAFDGPNQFSLFRAIVEEDVKVTPEDYRLTPLEVHTRVAQLHYRSEELRLACEERVARRMRGSGLAPLTAAVVYNRDNRSFDVRLLTPPATPRTKLISVAPPAATQDGAETPLLTSPQQQQQQQQQQQWSPLTDHHSCSIAESSPTVLFHDGGPRSPSPLASLTASHHNSERQPSGLASSTQQLPPILQASARNHSTSPSMGQRPCRRVPDKSFAGSSSSYSNNNTTNATVAGANNTSVNTSSGAGAVAQLLNDSFASQRGGRPATPGNQGDDALPAHQQHLGDSFNNGSFASITHNSVFSLGGTPTNLSLRLTTTEDGNIAALVSSASPTTSRDQQRRARQRLERRRRSRLSCLAIDPVTRDRYLDDAVQQMEDAQALLKDLTLKLLDRTVETRLSGDAVLEHPFFTCPYVVAQLYYRVYHQRALQRELRRSAITALAGVAGLSPSSADLASSMRDDGLSGASFPPLAPSSTFNPASFSSPSCCCGGGSGDAGELLTNASPGHSVSSAHASTIVVPSQQRPDDWRQLFLERKIHALYTPRLRTRDDLRYFPSAVTATGLSAAVEQHRRIKEVKEQQREMLRASKATMLNNHINNNVGGGASAHHEMSGNASISCTLSAAPSQLGAAPQSAGGSVIVVPMDAVAAGQMQQLLASSVHSRVVSKGGNHSEEKAEEAEAAAAAASTQNSETGDAVNVKPVNGADAAAAAEEKEAVSNNHTNSNGDNSFVSAADHIDHTHNVVAATPEARNDASVKPAVVSSMIVERASNSNTTLDTSIASAAATTATAATAAAHPLAAPEDRMTSSLTNIADLVHTPPSSSNTMTPAVADSAPVCAPDGRKESSSDHSTATHPSCPSLQQESRAAAGSASVDGDAAEAATTTETAAAGPGAADRNSASAERRESSSEQKVGAAAKPSQAALPRPNAEEAVSTNATAVVGGGSPSTPIAANTYPGAGHPSQFDSSFAGSQTNAAAAAAGAAATSGSGGEANAMLSSSSQLFDRAATLPQSFVDAALAAAAAAKKQLQLQRQHQHQHQHTMAAAKSSTALSILPGEQDSLQSSVTAPCSPIQLRRASTTALADHGSVDNNDSNNVVAASTGEASTTAAMTKDKEEAAAVDGEGGAAVGVGGGEVNGAGSTDMGNRASTTTVAELGEKDASVEAAGASGDDMRGAGEGHGNGGVVGGDSSDLLSENEDMDSVGGGVGGYYEQDAMVEEPHAGTMDEMDNITGNTSMSCSDTALQRTANETVLLSTDTSYESRHAHEASNPLSPGSATSHGDGAVLLSPEQQSQPPESRTSPSAVPVKMLLPAGTASVGVSPLNISAAAVAAGPAAEGKGVGNQSSAPARGMAPRDSGNDTIVPEISHNSDVSLRRDDVGDGVDTASMMLHATVLEAASGPPPAPTSSSSPSPPPPQQQQDQQQQNSRSLVAAAGEPHVAATTMLNTAVVVPPVSSASSSLSTTPFPTTTDTTEFGRSPPMDVNAVYATVPITDGTTTTASTKTSDSPSPEEALAVTCVCHGDAPADSDHKHVEHSSNNSSSNNNDVQGSAATSSPSCRTPDMSAPLPPPPSSSSSGAVAAAVRANSEEKAEVSVPPAEMVNEAGPSAHISPAAALTTAADVAHKLDANPAVVDVRKDAVGRHHSHNSVIRNRSDDDDDNEGEVDERGYETSGGDNDNDDDDDDGSSVTSSTASSSSSSGSSSSSDESSSSSCSTCTCSTCRGSRDDGDNASVMGDLVIVAGQQKNSSGKTSSNPSGGASVRASKQPTPLPQLHAQQQQPPNVENSYNDDGRESDLNTTASSSSSSSLLGSGDSLISATTSPSTTSFSQLSTTSSMQELYHHDQGDSANKTLNSARRSPGHEQERSVSGGGVNGRVGNRSASPSAETTLHPEEEEEEEAREGDRDAAAAAAETGRQGSRSPGSSMPVHLATAAGVNITTASPPGRFPRRYGNLSIPADNNSSMEGGGGGSRGGGASFAGHVSGAMSSPLSGDPWLSHDSLSETRFFDSTVSPELISRPDFFAPLTTLSGVAYNLDEELSGPSLVGTPLMATETSPAMPPSQQTCVSKTPATSGLPNVVVMPGGGTAAAAAAGGAWNNSNMPSGGLPSSGRDAKARWAQQQRKRINRELQLQRQGQPASSQPAQPPPPSVAANTPSSGFGSAFGSRGSNDDEFLGFTFNDREAEVTMMRRGRHSSEDSFDPFHSHNDPNNSRGSGGGDSGVGSTTTQQRSRFGYAGCGNQFTSTNAQAYPSASRYPPAPGTPFSAGGFASYGRRDNADGGHATSAGGGAHGSRDNNNSEGSDGGEVGCRDSNAEDDDDDVALTHPSPPPQRQHSSGSNLSNNGDGSRGGLSDNNNNNFGTGGFGFGTGGSGGGGFDHFQNFSFTSPQILQQYLATANASNRGRGGAGAGDSNEARPSYGQRPRR